MSMLCVKNSENGNLSQPFKFIGFPLYCVLLFILYWFLYCPLMFVKVSYLSRYNDWPIEWPFYFWSVAFIIFLILLGILVLLWRLSPKNKNQLFQVNYINEKVIEENTSLVICEKKLELDDNLKKLEENEDIVTTPLTPRELFFYDLIESANKSFNSSIRINQNRASTGGQQEFFIANVSPTRNCVSNVFLFVNPEESQPDPIQETYCCN